MVEIFAHMGTMESMRDWRRTVLLAFTCTVPKFTFVSFLFILNEKEDSLKKLLHIVTFSVTERYYSETIAI